MTQANTVPEGIMERIRKCLNLGDKTKGATEAEAEAAISMAKKLMAQHNLSMSDVEFKQEQEAGATESADQGTRSKKVFWERYLARVCNYLFSCCHYYSKRREASGKFVDRVIFVGVGQDSKIASEAYTILMDVLARMAHDAGYRDSVAEANAYRMGVVDTLLKRAKEASQGELTPIEMSRCKDIMVIKNQLVEAHLKTLSLRPGRASSGHIHGSNQAYERGKRDGRTVNLSFRNSLEVK